MKTMLQHKINLLKGIVLVALALGMPHAATAQYFRPERKLHIGVEAGIGVRSFKVSSDIEALKGMKVQANGFNVGLVLGSDAISARGHQGFYKSTTASDEKVNMKEAGLNVNVFPLRLLHKKSGPLKPYLSLGISRNTMIFVGSYELPEIPKAQNGGNGQCTCSGSGGMMEDPDGVQPATPIQPVALESPEDPETRVEEEELGRISDTRFNAGLGAQLVLPHGRYFIALFGEMNYGLRLNSTPSSIEFSKTSVSAPIQVNVGVAIGLRSR